MRSASFWTVPALTLLMSSFPLLAHAGRNCLPQKPTVENIERSMALAQRTAQALDTSGAQVVVLGRAGQDLSAYHLRYSHLGWAYKDAAGLWRVVHKLNTCGTATGAIYRQGLGEFFLDDLWRYEAVWAIPRLDVQQRLLPVLQNNAQATRWHVPAYSMVSYAWGQKYQQSNQWALETLAAALEPSIQHRAQTQDWLRFKAYTPSTLKVGPLTRLGGRMTAANIAFDDHPPDKRFSSRIETVTVDSVLQWLQRSELSGSPQVTR